MERVNVAIDGAKKNSDWARKVTAVEKDARTGHDWTGDWLPVGATVDIEVGTLILVCLKDRKGTDYRMSVVLPNGRRRRIEESSNDGWAQELRATAREWLALSPAERICRAARERIAEVEGMSADKQAQCADEIALRRQWLAEYSSGTSARDAAIAKIRELMAEHGIRAEDLS